MSSALSENKVLAHGNGIDGNDYQTGSAANGYQSGGAMSRFVTPGGNPIDSTQPAFPVYHRKFGNPAPLGLMR